MRQENQSDYLIKQLLLFIGALLYLGVMVIISPLLLVVYSFIGLLITIQFIKSRKVKLPPVSIKLKWPQFSFQLKKYILFYKS
jgi:hypothetical protein